jgi:hypothetical protein
VYLNAVSKLSVAESLKQQTYINYWQLEGVFVKFLPTIRVKDSIRRIKKTYIQTISIPSAQYPCVFNYIRLQAIGTDQKHIQVL